MRLNRPEQLTEESVSSSDVLEYCTDQQVAAMQRNNETTQDSSFDPNFRSQHKEIR